MKKEISKENPDVLGDLFHSIDSSQNTVFDLFKPHDLSAIDNIRQKNKRPDVDSIFNHIKKS